MAEREQAILVDANDTIIGYKYRDELVEGDRFRIVGVWLENHLGQVLIAQRSHRKKHHASLWGAAAAGGVARGESYEESAYKELEEEIGISSVQLHKASKELVTNPENNVERFCQWFIGRIETDSYDMFTLSQEEVAHIHWIDKQILLEDVLASPQHYTPSCENWPTLFAANNLV